MPKSKTTHGWNKETQKTICGVDVSNKMQKAYHVPSDLRFITCKKCKSILKSRNKSKNRVATKSKPKKSANKPHEITLTLTLKEQGNKLYFHQDFVKGNEGKRKMQVMSGAGCGNPYLLFRLEEKDGKVYRYFADVSDLLIQFADRSKELKHSK